METLRKGNIGADVELLQLALIRAGFAGHTTNFIDGIFGQITHDSLVAFQTHTGITPDGIAGTQTWFHLMPYIQGYFIRRIVRGDTFFSLAKQFNTTVQAISTANPQVDPQNISLGQQLIIPLNFSVVPTNITYTSHMFTHLVDGLTKRYPFLKTGTMGKSVMGKDLTYISIGSGNLQVSYNASHHANEWITTPILLKYLEDYSLEFSRGGCICNIPAADLYNKATLYMVPLLNPDGVDLVAGTLNSGIYYINARTYAANYPSIPFPTGWKANISGIDLNLQYPADWEEARRIKFAQGFTTPAPRDYVGPSPLSAPESKALYCFTLNHDFSLTLAYHTQGQVIFWRFKDYLPYRSYEIALKMGEISGYSVEETPSASANAGYKDWFIQQFDRPGYTIEAGYGINPLPIAQFDSIYNDNIGILTLGISYL